MRMSTNWRVSILRPQRKKADVFKVIVELCQVDAIVALQIIPRRLSNPSAPEMTYRSAFAFQIKQMLTILDIAFPKHKDIISVLHNMGSF